MNTGITQKIHATLSFALIPMYIWNSPAVVAVTETADCFL